MEEPGFTVRDRRIQFDESGDGESAPTPPPASTQQPAADSTPEPTAAPTADAVDTPPQGAAEPAPERPAAPNTDTDPMGSDGGPAIDYSSFVFSLAHAALIHLGLEPGPDGQPVPVNATAARQNIDVLAMVQDKTKGNLSAEEAELTEKLLYTLRMSFVEVSRGGQDG